MRCGAVFSGFMHLHLTMRFSYYMHLHLLTLVLMPCGVGAILRFELDLFRWDWVSPNVNFNLKNLPLLQLKILANYSIQI